jgi:hypothetical protein
VGEELVENGNLLHDVVAYLGYLGEEEEGEEAGYTAETGGEDTVLGGLVEGEAVVVLGDGVSVGRGVMLLAWVGWRGELVCMEGRVVSGWRGLLGGLTSSSFFGVWVSV